MNYSHAHQNTDKFSGGLGIYRGHNYQLLYKNFLKDSIKNILEVGTANGGFAKFLRDNNCNYFLVGAEIAPNDKHGHVPDSTNYNSLYDDLYVGDAFTDLFINWIKDKNYKFDFVIEDGDHDPITQKFMIANSYNLLSDVGVYVCEDVQSYSIAVDLLASVPFQYRKYSYIYDGSRSGGKPDDICVVIDLR